MNEFDFDFEVVGETKSEKAKRFLKNAKDFLKDHKVGVFAAATTLVNLSCEVSKRNRSRQITKEEKRKCNRIYDRGLGIYWETKKMSNNDRLEFEARKRNGESVGQILRSMNKLK